MPIDGMEREPADDMFAALALGKKKPSALLATEEHEGGDLPPGFDVAAEEAFPDMLPEQYPALKRLITLCMEKY